MEVGVHLSTIPRLLATGIVNDSFKLMVFVMNNSIVVAVDIRKTNLTGHGFYYVT